MGGSPSTPASPSPGETSVTVFNRQRFRRVQSAGIRSLAESVARRLGVKMELGIHLVSSREMARVNWQFLRHEGSTDVITFDHGSTSLRLHGELFISVEDSVRQATEFNTDWAQELARYVIHGILHLKGYDDLEPGARRLMKREEGRLVRLEAKAATQLAGPPVLRTRSKQATRSASPRRSRPRR